MTFFKPLVEWTIYVTNIVYGQLTVSRLFYGEIERVKRMRHVLYVYTP